MAARWATRGPPRVPLLALVRRIVLHHAVSLAPGGRGSIRRFCRPSLPRPPRPPRPSRRPRPPRPPAPPAPPAPSPRSNDFAWLRNVDDPGVSVFLSNERKHVRLVLGTPWRQERQETLFAEMCACLEGQASSVPEVAHGYQHYLRFGAEDNLPRFCRRRVSEATAGATSATGKAGMQHTSDTPSHISGSTNTARARGRRRRGATDEGVVAAAALGPEEVLFDPYDDDDFACVELEEGVGGGQAPTGYVGLGTLKLSNDQHLLAYTLDTRGDETYSLHLKAVQGGEGGKKGGGKGALLLNDVVNFEWAGGGRRDGEGGGPLAIYYTTPDALRRPSRVRRHVLGTCPSEDVTLYEEEDPSFFLDVRRTKDGRFLTVTSNSKTTSEVRLLDLAVGGGGGAGQGESHAPAASGGVGAASRPPPPPPPPPPLRLLRRREAGVEMYVDHIGDDLYIVTNQGAAAAAAAAAAGAAAGAADYKVVRLPDAAWWMSSGGTTSGTTSGTTGGAPASDLGTSAAAAAAAGVDVADLWHHLARPNREGRGGTEEGAGPEAKAASEVAPEAKVEDMDLFDTHVVLYERHQGLPKVRVIRRNDETDWHFVPLPHDVDPHHHYHDRISSAGEEEEEGEGEEEEEEALLSGSSSSPPCVLTPGANDDPAQVMLRFATSSPLYAEAVHDYDLSRSQLITRRRTRVRSGAGGALVQGQGAQGGQVEEAEDAEDAEEEGGGTDARYDFLEHPPSYDPTDFTCRRIQCVSTDGTVSVPVTVVHRKDLVMDGTAPLLLEAYGAYGENLEPEFQPERLSLLRRGWVVALAHVRGGGELGKAWYNDGRLGRKRNTFDDLASTAHMLVRRGYTASDRMALIGTSAGALAAGVVVNEHPGLFRAVVLHAPFLDPLHTMMDPSLPLTLHEYDEWGDVRDPAVRRFLHGYSPCDNIRPGPGSVGGGGSSSEEEGSGSRGGSGSSGSSGGSGGSDSSGSSGRVADGPYPAMLVTSALNDPRVGYWEPAKWVAMLRQRGELAAKAVAAKAAAGGCSGEEEQEQEREQEQDGVVLFQCSSDEHGHFGAGGRYERFRRRALQVDFLLEHCGPPK